MNTIKEQVTNILEENNTAQIQFDLLLDRMNLDIQNQPNPPKFYDPYKFLKQRKQNYDNEDLFIEDEIFKNDENKAKYKVEGLQDSSPRREIHIYESLQGTIDFTNLEQHGFPHPEIIHFHKPGQLVGLYNLPASLRELYINDQLLQELVNLPPSLEILECDRNYLEELNLEKTKILRVLFCSENRLTKIDNLPHTLEIMHCNNNQIKRLHLQNITGLKTLYCSNNPAIILEGLPPSVVDFQMDTNPLFDSTQFCRNEGELLEREHADEVEQKIEVNDALNKFFQLKHKYEDAINKKKRAIYKLQPSKKRAKNKIAAFRPKCIYCNRPVGSVFKLIGDVYTAYCGDPKEPCKFNIKIYSGYTEGDLLFMLESTHKELEDLKTKIIRYKMDTIMNYINESESSSKFKMTMEKYNLYSKEYMEYMKRYNDTMYGEIRKQCIRDKQIRIYDILKTINEYLENGEIHEAVEYQVRELFPEIHNLQLLKYDIMEMNIVMKKMGGNFGGNPDEGGGGGSTPGDDGDRNSGPNKKVKTEPEVFSWFYQTTVAPQKLEVLIGEPAKVIHFTSA